MVVSRITAEFDQCIEEVWGVVTSIENYEWRSDLDNVDVIDSRNFIEYTRGGYATYFTTTAFIPYERWEFDMENSNMNGHWIGVFSEENNHTCIEFTEQVTVRKFFLKPLLKFYLRKQQRKYVSDLKEELHRVNGESSGSHRGRFSMT